MDCCSSSPPFRKAIIPFPPFVKGARGDLGWPGESHVEQDNAMNGYPIDQSHLDLDVYRLLLPFAASRGLHDLSTGDESDPLNRMREQFERSEASRLLLMVAVTIRNSVEKSTNPRVKRYLDASVGTLIENVNDPTDKPLTFREACHKIIHASDIEFCVAGNDEGRAAPITTEVELFGKKCDRGTTFEWKARLDVAEFARHAYNMTL